MRYFFQDQNGQVAGPYTMDELKELHLHGGIKPDTPMVAEGDARTILFKDLWSRMSGGSAGSFTARPDPASSSRPSFVEDFARRANEDLRALRPHLWMPWEELKGYRWLRNRKLVLVLGIGLLPLLIIAITENTGSIRVAYWAMAFYFSALWALFFYYVFPAPYIKISLCVLSFFGTGILSLAILSLVYLLPPINYLVGMVRSGFVLFRWLGFVYGVGFPEETCKALVLFYILKTRGALPPQTMLFYGLMAGLGFGIYEGVDYQTRSNLFFAENVGEYYLLNMIRLTTLPFLHAIWTGIAGYFVGFAALYPERRRGLLIVGIGLPALLHGSYDTFGTSVLALGFASLSVLALVLYLSKSVDFENALRAQDHQC